MTLNEENALTVELLEAMPIDWTLQRTADQGWSIWDPTTDVWQAWDCSTAAEALRQAGPAIEAAQ